ncbi:hypothetical protein TNIN_104791 [Trichonephila inaurata madagascariensis]|uniref:Uncharacterized protein n=1 Tax=Trichonephila inaurata madagascariensis TaxID=2747483 RepID=A0A8X6X602_9ARAC|nr:hypothetical protein TNIN_104791 [Trichonephila inaurata madagascariensis]
MVLRHHTLRRNESKAKNRALQAINKLANEAAPATGHKRKEIDPLHVKFRALFPAQFDDSSPSRSSLLPIHKK